MRAVAVANAVVGRNGSAAGEGTRRAWNLPAEGKRPDDDGERIRRIGRRIEGLRACGQRTTKHDDQKSEGKQDGASGASAEGLHGTDESP
jgi:hypothetical protein